MWLLTWPPSLDWCQHVAVLDMLVRLQRGEPAVTAMLQFKPQPVGYHVLYLVAFPLALASNAALALRATMTLLLAAHVASLGYMLRRCRAPAILALTAIPAFYSVHFAWGALVTMMATPFVVVAIALLVGTDAPPTRRQWLGAASCALMAGLSHVIFLPVLLVASFLSLLLWPVRQRAWAAAIAFGAALSGAPSAAGRLLSMLGEEPAQATTSSYVDFETGMQYFEDITHSFDRRFAMQGWGFLWGGLLVLTISSLTEEQTTAKRKQQLFLCAMAAICIAMIWCVPLHTTGPLGTAYLLNIRALCLLPFLGAVLAADNRLWTLPVMRLITGAVLSIAAALTLLGVYQFGREYDAEVSDYVAQSRILPPHTRLAIESQVVPLGKGWPPFRQSMGVAAFSSRLAFSDGIFINNQMPVHERVEGSYGRLRSATTDFVQHLYDESLNEAATVNFWSLADALFYQAPALNNAKMPPAARAIRLASGRQWALFGPPPCARMSCDADICGCQYGCSPDNEEVVCMPPPNDAATPDTIYPAGDCIAVPQQKPST